MTVTEIWSHQQD